jgi:TRAP-type C4-dicarboxylate transport system permease small subunit
VSFLLGCAGLLIAMVVDVSSVIGRHSGMPLLGSIELMRACVVVFASSALLGTTLGRGHASVHMLTERLPNGVRDLLQRAAALASALFFGILIVGSCIVIHDLWHGAETSELLQLPIMPLRLFFCASLLAIVCVFLVAGFGRKGSRAS